MAHRPLGGEDAAEGHRDRGEVDRTEGLGQQEDPEGGADHRVDEADDGDGTGIHPGQASEPQDVAQGRPHQAEVGQGQQGRRVEGGRRPLHGGGDGHEEQAARDELPRRRDEHALGRRPPLDEDEAQGRREHGADRRRHTERVDSSVALVLPHQGHHSGDADHGRHQGDPGLTLAKGEEGQPHEHERRERGERRGEPARQAVGREVQQGEEDSVVEGAEQGRAAPPRAPGQAAHPQEQEQPGGEHAGGRGEEGAVGRQPELGHGIRRAPHDGGHGCQDDVHAARGFIFHGR